MLGFAEFELIETDLTDFNHINDIFKKRFFDTVFHLGAQAGVRHSFQDPRKYFDSNLLATFNLLEASRITPVNKFVFASTSSVYGNSKPMPFQETNALDPIQFYAITKKSGEEMCKYYATEYDIPTFVFRFFTVYGPWGRPDMALHKFTESFLRGIPLEVYNHGDHSRSFTYIDDIIHYLKLSIKFRPPENFEIFNLGNPNAVDLMTLVHSLESKIKLPYSVKYLDLQKGDVRETMPDVTKLINFFGSRKFTKLDEGIEKFLTWHRLYYEKF